MSDTLIMSVLGLGMLWSLRQPWVGVILWTWVSLMSPHVQFGWRAAEWPVGTGVAGCTLIGLMLTKQRHNPFVGSAVWALLAFSLWICVTLPFSFYLDDSLPLWERSMKIFLMVFVTLALIDDRRKLDFFVWIIVISLAFYGVKGGLFTILTGGNYRIWGPGGFIGGNNELALALIMTIPLMRYLQLQMTRRWASLAMLGAMGLCAVAILGTYSRGALLGICGMTGFFWWRSKNKLRWGTIILITAAAALSLMPEQWWGRMETVQTYDSDDSALGRINAWWMAFNLAQANFFGGGFMIYVAPVFQKYSPDPDRVHAAHSIYFQILGEHGFVGLFLFLLIGLLTWTTAHSLIRAARNKPEHRWAADLGAMVQVSMIGYAISGAFLSMAYFDLPYNLTAICLLGRHFVRRADKAAARALQQPAIAAGAPATERAGLTPGARRPAAMPASVATGRLPNADPS